MKIPNTGKDRSEIMKMLDDYKSGDVGFRSGKVFAYTFNPGEDAENVLKEAYMKYLSENALDPTSFPSVVKLEREVVRMVAGLLRGDENVVGNFTSGGTESIMLAVKSARDMARAERPEITKPEMVLPQSAHCAFHKAAHYFDVKPVVVTNSAEDFRAIPDAMRAAITPNTILLAASAPSYAQGVVDPIREIGEIALEKNLLFHVDACMGGIMLSVLREVGGYDIPDFDYSVPGVTSISADMHKFGYAAKGASTITYRNKDIRRHQIFASTASTSYALINATILSSKSGGPMAAAWAILNYLGMEGYGKIFTSVMDATKKMIDGINATGDLYVPGKPAMCIFSVASKSLNVYQIADIMKKKGWYLQPQFCSDTTPQTLHITMNYSNVPFVDEFLADLNVAVKELKESKSKLDYSVVKEQVQNMLKNIDGDPFEALSAMAGISGSDIPDDMALISCVLNALPKNLSEAMLADYVNSLFT